MYLTLMLTLTRDLMYLMRQQRQLLQLATAQEVSHTDGIAHQEGGIAQPNGLQLTDGQPQCLRSIMGQHFVAAGTHPGSQNPKMRRQGQQFW